MPAKIVAAVNINGSNLVLTRIWSTMDLHLWPAFPSHIPARIDSGYSPENWLEENGVDVSQVDIKAMDPGPAMSALSAGKIDGVFLPHPSPSIIELNGKGVGAVASGEMWPDHACCSL